MYLITEICRTVDKSWASAINNHKYSEGHLLYCLLGSVICFTGGYRRFRVDVSSYLEGTVVKFADREQVVDDMIGVIGVTAV